MNRLNRKQFIARAGLLGAAALLPTSSWASASDLPESAFSKRLKPIGRALELEGYYVWCNSPIIGPDGKTHVFFSRWDEKRKMSGWIHGSEIAHAVSSGPHQPFDVVGTVLAPRGPGHWDATTCHNPLIKYIDGSYYLFYMGNSNGKTDTKRIGLATSGSLYGPWKRSDQPLLLPGSGGGLDDHCTTNPAWVAGLNGESLLYYKSWNTHDYLTAADPAIRGNRKYGLAIATQPEGPYHKYRGNPVVDFSSQGNNRQFEDAFVWYENQQFQMIARDMGVFDHAVGLLMQSKDGINWSSPQIAYKSLSHYVQQPPAPNHLKRYGRLERPMLLLDGQQHPTHLFGASQGGKYMTSSAFVFEVNK